MERNSSEQSFKSNSTDNSSVKKLDRIQGYTKDGFPIVNIFTIGYTKEEKIISNKIT